MWILLISFMFLHAQTHIECRISYDRYSLFRITPVSQPQLQYILSLNSNSSSGLDFWLRSTAVNSSADVMVSPCAKADLLENLKQKSIPYTVLLPDLGRIIEEDMKSKVNLPDELQFFGNYSSVEEMQSFMEDLADKYPSCVKVIDIGYSYEGRSLKGLKISRESGKPKPVIWIQSGAHARELIGPAVVLYIALNLTSSCSKNNSTFDLIDDFDWYIYPVVNPDGYEYARTTDRLWRKTRSQNEDNPGCIGADANRNWDFHWSGALGASTDPCSHNYAGVMAFSEPETRAIAEFLEDELEGQLHIFLDFHSYSQRWLTPWGYTSDLPSNYLDQKELAEAATTALEKVYGTKYSVGSSGNIMYTVTGGARDWVYGILRAPFSYVIELRDKGQMGGFLLPRNQILPTSQETWVAVKTMANSAAQKLKAMR